MLRKKHSDKSEVTTETHIASSNELPKIKSSHSLDELVIKSSLQNADPAEQARNILSAFNQGITKSAFTTSIVRGEWVNPDEFVVGAKNKMTELAPFNRNYKIAKSFNFSPNVNSEILATVKQYDKFYGRYGRFVLNVPPATYAIAKSGLQSQIYGPGPHVIHDPTFQFDSEDGFVNQFETYIQLPNIHILRIPKGKMAKIWFGTRPEILEYQEDPYVFDATNFKFDVKADLVSKSEPYIKHGTIHIIRVPKGKIAKIWIGNEPKILPYNEEPYVFNNPLVKFDEKNGFVNEYEPYIKHGTIHIIRVPKGKIMKAWDGNTPLFLQYQSEPYTKDSPLFRVEPVNGSEANNTKQELVEDLNEPTSKRSKKRNKNIDEKTFDINNNNNENVSSEEYFYSATASLIEHDSLKYVNPPTGQVAITYKNGKLVIITQDNENKIIDDPNHYVIGFQDVTIQNAVFPSEEQRKIRRSENKNATEDELSYEIFTTRDSLKVGVKLFVAYQVTDPEKAIRLLGKDGIAKHIENVATVDMGKAIQQSTSQEFLNFYQTKPTKQPNDNVSLIDVPKLPETHIQDIVKGLLGKDLEEYGIKLIRLNFETPKVLNKEISDQMEKQSLLSAKTNAEMAVIDKQTELNQKKAKQEADTKRIAQEQENAITLTKAETELKATELKAKAVIAEAEGKSKATIVEADAKAQATVLQAEAEKKARQMLGEQYKDFPELYHLEGAKIQTKALNNATMYITPKEMTGILSTPMSFFGGNIGLKQAPANNVDTPANDSASKLTVVQK